jgi:uncharacterized protein (DUF433 family)
MAHEHTLYGERIVQDPKIMVGKPVIRGTRIPVERIIDHLATTPDFDDLFAAYPRLTMEDVQAALAFAHDAVWTQSRPQVEAALEEATSVRA